MMPFSNWSSVPANKSLFVNASASPSCTGVCSSENFSLLHGTPARGFGSSMGRQFRSGVAPNSSSEPVARRLAGE